jgi:O-antigen ligase
LRLAQAIDRRIGALPAFVLVGYLATMGLFFAVGQLESLTAIALFLFAPLALCVLLLALPQAMRRWRMLRQQLTWWHALWLLLFLSSLVFRIRDVESIRDEPIDLWAVYRIVLVCIAALVLLVRLVVNRPEWVPSLFRGLIGTLTVYALISIASTLWSIYPAWSLYKSLEYLVDIALLGAVVATVRSATTYKTLFDWTWVLQAGLLGTVWMGALLWPSKAFVVEGELIPVRISGVLPAMDQNEVGKSAAFLAIVALSRLQFPAARGRQIFYWVVLACSVGTMVLSQTRVAIVGFLLGAVLVLFFSKRLGVITVLALTVVLLLSLTSFGNVVSKFWQRGENQESLQAFSGRLPVWEFGWQTFLKHPVLGSGAYAGGRFAVVAAVADPRWSSTLNEYLEIAAGTGICGLIPIVLGLIGAWWVLVRGARTNGVFEVSHQLAIEAIGIFAIITIHTFFGIDMIWHPAQSFLLIVGYAELLRREKHSRRSPRVTHLCAARATHTNNSVGGKGSLASP